MTSGHAHYMSLNLARQLERELIQAQQTIAQKDGEIGQMREALNKCLDDYRLDTKCGSESCDCSMHAYATERMNEVIAALSTITAPVAVVPCKVAEQALSEIVNLQAKLAAMEQEGWEVSKRRIALKAKLQSYAPKKGNQ